MSKRKSILTRKTPDWSWETNRSDFSFGCVEKDLRSQLRSYLQPGIHNLARSICVLALSAGVATAASAKQPTSDDWSRQLVITANPAIHSVITADIDKALDTTPTLREISLIDGNLSDLETLVTAARARGDVYVIRTDVDGVEAATRILAGYSGLDAVHIFSHGSAGHFNLGNAVVEASTLTFHEESFTAWSKSLTESADILVYGCNVGSSPAGKALLSSLSALTGADIAGSTDLTGALALKGNWTLEVTVGSIETPEFGAPAWKGVMPPALGTPGKVIAGDGSGGGGSASNFDYDNYTTGGAGGAGGGDADTITGTAGDDIIFGDGSGGGGGGGSGGDSYYSDSTYSWTIIDHGSAASYVGTGGAGGSGADTISGGAGNDIIFGDGFDGDNSDATYFSGGDGGVGGGGGGAGSGMKDTYSGYGRGGMGGIGGGGGGGGDYADGGNGGYGGGGGGGGGSGGDYGYGGGFGATDGYSGYYDGGGGGGGGGFFGIRGAGGVYLDGGAGGVGGNGGNGIFTGGNGGNGGTITADDDADYSGGGGGGGFSATGGDGASSTTSDDHGYPGEAGDTTEVSFDDDSAQTIHTFVKGEVNAGTMAGLPGGNGDDIIDGGPGSDDLFGMGGTNTFVFEANDATSGNDVDTIHDWTDGTANQIDIRVGGVAIDAATIDAIVAAQITDVDDRILTATDDTNTMSIIIKNIARDLVAGDFGAAPDPVVPPVVDDTTTPATSGSSSGGCFIQSLLD